MCETFSNFRKRKAFEKMLIVKSQFARSNTDTDLFFATKKQKDTIESRTDCINLEKPLGNKNYSPNKVKYAKLLNKDKRKLQEFILSNTSNLRLFGNKRYNEYHPFLFVRDQVQKLPNSKIGLLPLPMKCHKKLKTKDDIKKFKDVERSIVMMRRIQYTRKPTDYNRNYERTIDLSCIVKIQRWWKLMLKIIKIQRFYKTRCRRREAKLVSRLSDFFMSFDELLKRKLRKECIGILSNYIKNTTVSMKYSFSTKVIVKVEKKDSEKIVMIQSFIRTYLKKRDVHKHFKKSKYRVKPTLMCCYMTKYPKQKDKIIKMSKMRIINQWRLYQRNQMRIQKTLLAPIAITKDIVSYPNISAKIIQSIYRKYSYKIQLSIGKYNNEDLKRLKISKVNSYYTKEVLMGNFKSQTGTNWNKNKGERGDYYNNNDNDIEHNDDDIDNNNDNDNEGYSGSNKYNKILNKNDKTIDRNIITQGMINQLYKLEKNVCSITKTRLIDNSKSIISIQRLLNSAFLSIYKRQPVQACYVDKVCISLSVQKMMKFVESLTHFLSKNYFSKRTRRITSQKYIKPNSSSYYILNDNELKYISLIQREYKSWYFKANKTPIRKPKNCAMSSYISKLNMKDINSSILLIQRNVKNFKSTKQLRTVFKPEKKTLSYISKKVIFDCFIDFIFLQCILRNYIYTGKVCLNKLGKTASISKQSGLRKTLMNYLNTTVGRRYIRNLRRDKDDRDNGDNGNNRDDANNGDNENNRDNENNGDNWNNGENKEITDIIGIGVSKHIRDNRYIKDHKHFKDNTDRRSDTILHPSINICYISMIKKVKDDTRILKVKAVINKFNTKINTLVKESENFKRPLRTGCLITKERYDIKTANNSALNNCFASFNSFISTMPLIRETSKASLITKSRLRSSITEIIKIQTYYRGNNKSKPIDRKGLTTSIDTLYNDKNQNLRLNNSNSIIIKRDLKSSNYTQPSISKSGELIVNQQAELTDDFNTFKTNQKLTWYFSKIRISNVIPKIICLQKYFKKNCCNILKPNHLSVGQVTKVTSRHSHDIKLITLIQKHVRKLIPVYLSKSHMEHKKYISSTENFDRDLNEGPHSNQKTTWPICLYQSSIRPICLYQRATTPICLITKNRKNDQDKYVKNIQATYRKHIKVNYREREISNLTKAKIINSPCYVTKIQSYDLRHINKPILESSMLTKQIYVSEKQHQSISCIQRSFRYNHNKIKLKQKIKQNEYVNEISLEYSSKPKPILFKTVLGYSYMEKQRKRFINKPNLMFVSLVSLFASKNCQEYLFNFMKNKGKPEAFSYPFYINTLERHVKFIKSSQSQDSKVKDLFNEIFPSDNTRNIHEQIATLPKAKIKQLQSVNIYHSIEQDLINYLNSFCSYDKKLTNPAFISERLKQNKINNTNIFGLTRLIDEEFSNLLNGTYCYRCYFNIKSCHCALQEDEDDLFGEDSQPNDESSPKNRANNFEYDTTTCAGIVIKRKPKTEEGYEDPITQMICISDDKLIKKLQIKTSALIPQRPGNDDTYENEKEEIKTQNAMNRSSTNKEELELNETKDISNIKQLLLKQSYTLGNISDKSSYLEFDYNEEEK